MAVVTASWHTCAVHACHTLGVAQAFAIMGTLVLLVLSSVRWEVADEWHYARTERGLGRRPCELS